MNNDKTRRVIRWASKGYESSWKPAVPSCTKREPLELTPAKTRQGARRLPLSCLPIHRTRCRRTPFGSGYHRVLSCVARLLPTGQLNASLCEHTGPGPNKRGINSPSSASCVRFEGSIAASKASLYPRFGLGTWGWRVAHADLSRRCPAARLASLSYR